MKVIIEGFEVDESVKPTLNIWRCVITTVRR